MTDLLEILIRGSDERWRGLVYCIPPPFFSLFCFILFCSFVPFVAVICMFCTLWSITETQVPSL